MITASVTDDTRYRVVLVLRRLLHMMALVLTLVLEEHCFLVILKLNLSKLVLLYSGPVHIEGDGIEKSHLDNGRSRSGSPSICRCSLILF